MLDNMCLVLIYLGVEFEYMIVWYNMFYKIEDIFFCWLEVFGEINIFLFKMCLLSVNFYFNKEVELFFLDVLIKILELFVK